VWIPKNLSKEEQKTLEQLSGSENFQPQPTADDKNFFERMKNFFE
jgi:molecular chaperone DnaJ